MTDLYLIEPPPEATHAPIPPNQVVLGGDSAGGGLCLAMLQVCGHRCVEHTQCLYLVR
jgi:hypothetical protein